MADGEPNKTPKNKIEKKIEKKNRKRKNMHMVLTTEKEGTGNGAI